MTAFTVAKDVFSK